MTVASILGDLLFAGFFLIVGFVVREIFKPLKTFFIPASVVGGTILLLLGPQIYNLLSVPKSFETFSGVLIDLILCALVFGLSFDKSRARSYLDYTFVAFGMYGMQVAIGPLLAYGLAFIWPGLPDGWGIMGAFSFYGGHGTAAAAGGVFNQLGVADNTALGMILSTFGMLAAVIIGMVIVNIGIRKKQTKFLQIDLSASKEENESATKTLLPVAGRSAIGLERVSSNSIDNLAFQFALLGSALLFGQTLFKLLGMYINPFFTTVPGILHGVVGGFIIWFVIQKLGFKDYVDRRTISTISSFCLEIVIITAISTIKLSLVATYLAPILIYTATLVIATIAFVFFFCKKFCQNEWFEKALMMYGMGTGSAPTGLALVRAVDPKMQSSAGDAHAVYSTINLFSKVAPAILPSMMLANFWSVVGLGTAITLGGILGGWFFLRRK